MQSIGLSNPIHYWFLYIKDIELSEKAKNGSIYIQNMKTTGDEFTRVEKIYYANPIT